MFNKPVKLISLTAALAALPGAAMLLSPAANAKPNDPGTAEGVISTRSADEWPNVFMRVGKDLLGMIVKKGSDGIVTADHYSHSSHASHSSHYSGR
jgi:hypothetical protein